MFFAILQYAKWLPFLQYAILLAAGHNCPPTMLREISLVLEDKTYGVSYGAGSAAEHSHGHSHPFVSSPGLPASLKHLHSKVGGASPLTLQDAIFSTYPQLSELFRPRTPAEAAFFHTKGHQTSHTSIVPVDRERETTTSNKLEVEQESNNQVWRIKFPRSVEEVAMIHLGNPKSIPLRWIISEYANKTKKCSESHLSLDISEVNPKKGEWYFICAKQSIIVDQLSDSCFQCSLIRAGQELPKIGVQLGKVGLTRAHMLYDVGEFPLPNSQIRTLATPMDDLARCGECKGEFGKGHDHPATSGSRLFDNPIRANTVTAVTIEGLAPAQKYTITSHLLLNSPEVYQRLNVPDHVFVTCEIFDRGVLTLPKACKEIGYETFTISG